MGVVRVIQAGAIMTNHPLPPNHGRPWQDTEHGDVISRIGSELLTTTARRLGRKPEAIYTHLRPTNIREQAQRFAGMSTVDVAQALGVPVSRIRRWAKNGWLKQHRGYGIRGSYPTFDAYDVSQFLMERGGVIPEIQPTDLAWKEEVQAARAAIEVRCIDKRTLEGLLSVAHTAILYWRRHCGFPEPVFTVGRGAHFWFERAAVRDWLDVNDRWTTKARGGL